MCSWKTALGNVENVFKCDYLRLKYYEKLHVENVLKCYYSIL